MKYNTLGNTQIKVSEISFGTAGFGGVYGDIEPYSPSFTKLIKTALDYGINYFDTSPYYGALRSEEVLGRCLSQLDNIPRENYLISTKCGRYGKRNDASNAIESIFDFSPETVVNFFHQSLKRLNLKSVDILYLHDIEFCENDSLLIKSTLPALEKLVLEGKVGALGVSGFPLRKLDEFIEKSKGVLNVVLSYCHSTLVSDLLSPFSSKWRDKGLGVINASPLAMGLLSEKGPPEWHPASKNLKRVARKAVTHCMENRQNISKIALRKSVGRKDADSVMIGLNSHTELMDAISVLDSGECRKNKPKTDFGKGRNDDFEQDDLERVEKECDSILSGAFNELWEG